MIETIGIIILGVMGFTAIGILLWDFIQVDLRGKPSIFK